MAFNCKVCGKYVEIDGYPPRHVTYYSICESCSNTLEAKKREVAQEFKIKKVKKCSSCEGTGQYKGYKCATCEGSGKIVEKWYEKSWNIESEAYNRLSWSKL